jgi:hypothetical protein
LTVKRLRLNRGGLPQVPESPAYPSLGIRDGQDLAIWSAVAHAMLLN